MVDPPEGQPTTPGPVLNANLQMLENTPASTPRYSGDAGGGSGSQFKHRYYDRTEDVVPVTRSDLREIAEFGWLEEGVGAAGMFFASGAFWQLPVIFVEHGNDMKGAHWAWVGACVLSIAFGGVLLWIASRHFKMRDQRVKHYFKSENEPH